SNDGFIRNRDTLPQAADYLLRLEGISTVLVFGIVDSTVHMSARSNDIRTHIGSIMEQAFGKIGNAGGHAQAAAAQIQLGLFGVVEDKETLIKMAGEAVTRRFFEVVGVSGKK
ncbi:MAG: potassium transporter TrkA, partial [Methanobacteriota archaeon]